MVGGGGEAGHVGDHAPAHADDDVAARQPPRGEGPAEVLDGRQRLGGLTVADREHPLLDPGVDLEADAGLGHDGRTADAGRQHVGQVGRGIRPDQHRIGAVARQRDVDADHDGAALLPAGASCRSSQATTSSAT